MPWRMCARRDGGTADNEWVIVWADARGTEAKNRTIAIHLQVMETCPSGYRVHTAPCPPQIGVAVYHWKRILAAQMSPGIHSDADLQLTQYVQGGKSEGEPDGSECYQH